VSGYALGAAVLMIGGLGPALWVACHGRVEERLVGLQLVAPVVVVLLLLLAVDIGQPSSLIVPVVLAVLSPAGTLVFTRMVAPHADADNDGDR
jgi:multisubunit Na+/H+ antiporter MnhF subunit